MRKKTIIRLVCLLLSIASAALLFGGCAKKPENLTRDGKYILKNEKAAAPGTPEEKIDPASFYGSIACTPDVFIGNYVLSGGNEALDAMLAEAEFTEIAGIGDRLTTLPYTVHAYRRASVDGTAEYIAALSFLDENGLSHIFECPYQIDNGKLICSLTAAPAAETAEGEETKEAITTVLTFPFSFSGINLTLSAGEKQIVLSSGLFTPDNPQFYFSHEIVSSGDVSCPFRAIGFHYKSASDTSLTLILPDGMEADKPIAELNENGLFTVSYKDGETIVTKQFVFFFASADALVLADESGTYVYADPLPKPAEETETFPVTEPQTEPETVPETIPSEEEIERKREDLIEDLSKALKAAGINAKIDPENGLVELDSTVLFEGNSDELKDNGKALLNKLIPVYASVVFTEEYEKFVSRIVIEGHTAPVSGVSYEGGLALSRKRAEIVRDFCLTVPGIDEESRAKLKSTIEAIGKSNSEPIYKADGSPDMNASRRVTFRFVIGE